MAVGALELSTGLRAATFEDLNIVTIEPNLESQETRSDSIQRAMAQLLTRMTGRREAAAYPELGPLVDGAVGYMTEYGVLEGRRIRVGFNASAVTRALESANWPVWGAERPMTLLWIAVDFGNAQRAVLAAGPREPSIFPELDEFMDGVEEEVLRVADERGLPVTLPLLDLEDQQAISFVDIWGGFESTVERASERYAADTVLVGRIAVTEYGPEVRWTALQDGRGRMIVASTIREGLDWIADQYASEYSIIGGARLARISILGVEDVNDYLRVMSHLNTLSVLQTVDVEEYADDVLTLRVAARGDNRVLERVLTLGGVLVTSGQDFAPDLYDANLVFRMAESIRPL